VSQPGLFDDVPDDEPPPDPPAAARAARDDGMARAAEHAPAPWLDRAQAALRGCCLARAEFIVDDVWAFLPAGDRPPEARAMGPVILAGVKAGWCAKTDQYRPSSQPQCHCNPRRVWRSLIVAPQG
jgi:hypothetical protein